MIGPSSGATGEVTENHCRSSKRKVFDDLDIDSFCEEICQTSHKRYLQELETPIEFVATNDIVANENLFSPISTTQETVEEPSVTRLEVLLVEGTNCTWTTVSELEQQQALDFVTSCSSSSSSWTSSAERHREQGIPETYTIEENNYQPAVSVDYWESTAVPIVDVSPTNLDVPKNKGTINVNDNQQQQQLEDQETGNLSWLLDFKLDSLIEATDDRSTGPTMKDSNYGNKNKLNGRSYCSNYANDFKKGYSNNENLLTHRQDSTNQVTYPANGYDNRNFTSSRTNGPKKPPFTYTELIEHALQEKGELTVSAIYQWISEHFPYYKSNDDRWKNSVRHNLSINPHFRKGSKAPHGAGHLWAIANRVDCRPRPLVLNGATASVRQIVKNDCIDSQKNGNTVSDIITMNEVEAATASITQQNSEDETDVILNSVTLEHSAEQILNGIKREVEVQYLVPMMVTNNDQDANQQSQQTTQTELTCSFKESDFLNPVSKEVVAEECGLISEGYLVTDLNPNTLGLNIVDSEIIGSENLFGEELSFQFYELTSPSQLQSA